MGGAAPKVEIPKGVDITGVVGYRPTPYFKILSELFAITISKQPGL